MKTTVLALALALAGLSSLSAAPIKGPMLLAGESHRDLNDLTLIAKGNAYAIIGNFSVTAGQITYDRVNRQLKAYGVTAISSGHSAPGAKDVTLEVDVENVYQLNPAGIVINGNSTTASDENTFRGHVFTRAHQATLPAAPTGSSTSATGGPTPFSKTLPKLQLNLRPSPTAPSP